MGLTNHIILNMVGSVFHHIPSGGEGKKIRVLIIKRNKELIIRLNSLKYPEGKQLDCNKGKLLSKYIEACE